MHTRFITSPEHAEIIALEIGAAVARYGRFRVPVAQAIADDNGSVRLVVEDVRDGQLYHAVVQPVCQHLWMPVEPATPEGRCAKCAQQSAG